MGRAFRLARADDDVAETDIRISVEYLKHTISMYIKTWFNILHAGCEMCFAYGAFGAGRIGS